MLEILTGFGLSTAAGLNAYIPLLGLGLLARFTDLVALPDGWAWLENGWSLGVVGALLLIEVLVDKFPALDSVNDVLQTAVRPAAGGMVFSAGAASETVAVSDPAAFAGSGQLWTFVLGAAIALIPHILKSLVRPVINALTMGAGAAVTSFLEDLGALLITVLAVIVPVLAVLFAILAIVLLIRRLGRLRSARAERRAAAPLG